MTEGDVCPDDAESAPTGGNGRSGGRTLMQSGENPVHGSRMGPGWLPSELSLEGFWGMSVRFSLKHDFPHREIVVKHN